MTRLKYKKTNHILESEFLLGDNNFFKVVINLKKMSGMIKDFDNKRRIVFKSNSLDSLKKLAKKNLTNCGINFTPEVRPNKKGKQNG